jgi:hypothetical protein
LGGGRVRSGCRGTGENEKRQKAGCDVFHGRRGWGTRTIALQLDRDEIRFFFVVNPRDAGKSRVV